MKILEFQQIREPSRKFSCHYITRFCIDRPASQYAKVTLGSFLSSILHIVYLLAYIV